jgi:hypothetical protein
MSPVRSVDFTRLAIEVFRAILVAALVFVVYEVASYELEVAGMTPNWLGAMYRVAHNPEKSEAAVGAAMAIGIAEDWVNLGIIPGVSAGLVGLCLSWWSSLGRANLAAATALFSVVIVFENSGVGVTAKPLWLGVPLVYLSLLGAIALVRGFSDGRAPSEPEKVG